MVLLRGPGVSFALLIIAPLALFNLYSSLYHLLLYFPGFNSMYGSRYLKSYTYQDLIYDNVISNVRITGS